MRPRWPVLLCFVALLAGCPSPRVTQGPDELLAAGSWTVNGVGLGASLTQVVSVLGPSQSTPAASTSSAPTYSFGKKKSVKFKGFGGKSIRVQGTELHRDGQTVLRVGQDEATLIAALGTGYVYQLPKPKASGMWSIVDVPDKTFYFYHDGEGRQVEVIVSQLTNKVFTIILREYSNNPEHRYWLY